MSEAETLFVALRQSAEDDVVDMLEPAQEIGDQLRIEHPAADARVTRPVAQKRGRHRCYVDAVHLHGKHGGAVADMAEGDLRLNRNHGHAVTIVWAGSPKQRDIDH